MTLAPAEVSPRVVPGSILGLVIELSGAETREYHSSFRQQPVGTAREAL